MSKILNILLLLMAGLAMISCGTNSAEDNDTTVHYIEVNTPEEARDFYTWSVDRFPLVSAHRGGSYPGFPENSIEAMENVIAHTPAIIEFDVAITKDSVLVLMHDNSVDRTTTGEGRVSEFTFEEIRNLKLVDIDGQVTAYQVPTLEEVLDWGRGKVLFTVDVKKEVPFEMVVAAIKKQNAEPYAAVISYNLVDAERLHILGPELMLSVTVRNDVELERLEKSTVQLNRVIAFTGTSARPTGMNDLLHQRGIFTILGVMGNLDKSAEARGDRIYLGLVQGGADILATDRPIEVAKTIRELFPTASSKSKFFKP